MPPLNETAVKLAKYFLVQSEAEHWEPETKSVQFRFKRQVERRRTFFPYDVLFVIDSSGSIRKSEFVLGIDALIRLISKARPDTLYASITYSTFAKINFLFESAELAKRLVVDQILPLQCPVVLSVTVSNTSAPVVFIYLSMLNRQRLSLPH